MIGRYLISHQGLNKGHCPNSLFSPVEDFSPQQMDLFSPGESSCPQWSYLNKRFLCEFFIPSGSLLSLADRCAEVFIFPTEFPSSAESHMHPQQNIFSSRISLV